MLVTVKWRSLNIGVDPPLQSLATVQKTPAVKKPVPSAWNGARLVDPETPPGMTVTVAPLSVVVMPVIVEPAMLSLKAKSMLPPAPVSTNLFPLVSTTSTATFDPLWFTVTVPNVAGVVQPPVIWQDVNENVSA